MLNIWKKNGVWGGGQGCWCSTNRWDYFTNQTDQLVRSTWIFIAYIRLWWKIAKGLTSENLYLFRTIIVLKMRIDFFYILREILGRWIVNSLLNQTNDKYENDFLREKWNPSILLIHLYCEKFFVNGLSKWVMRYSFGFEPWPKSVKM